MTWGGDASKARIASQAIDKIPTSGGSSGAGGLRLYPTYDSEMYGTTLDKAAKEIADAFDEHGNVYWINEIILDDSTAYKKYFIYYYETTGVRYKFYMLPADYVGGETATIFEANTPTSYPVAEDK